MGIGALSGGGAEKQVHLLAEGLDPERFEVRIGHVLSTVNDPPISELVSRAYFPRRSTLHWHKVWRGVASDLREYKPDLVHVWLPEVITIPASVLAYVRGIPVVSSIRRSTFKGIARSQYLRELAGLMPHLLSRKIVSNFPINEEPVLVQSLCRQHNHEVIFNGLDTERKGCDKNGIEVDENKLRLAYVGRFAQQKRLPFLLKTLGRFKRESRRSFSLSVFGRGNPSQEEAVRDIVFKNDLNKEVVFEGFQPEWRKKATRFNYLIFPSLSEGMPNVVAESLAEGLPVIASDILELSPFVEPEKNGFLFDPKDADALLALLQDVPLGGSLWASLSEASLKKAQEFSISEMVQAYEKAYTELIEA